MENKKEIKAIIFDFDDTLYNGPVWENWGSYTKNYVYTNFENPDEIYKKYGFTCNSNGASFVKMTIAEKGISQPFYDYQLNNVCELNLTDVVVVDNDRLRELSKKYKLFIVSNSSITHLNYYSEKMGIDTSCFTGIYDNQFKTENLTKTLRYQEIIDTYKLKPDSIFVIGDNPKNDIEPAIAMGMRGECVKILSELYKVFDELMGVRND